MCAYGFFIDLFNKQHDIGIYIVSDIARFAIGDGKEVVIDGTRSDLLEYLRYTFDQQ